MTNAEARFNKSLRPRKPEGSLGRTAQDVHLDSHTAPELRTFMEAAHTAYILCYPVTLQILKNTSTWNTSSRTAQTSVTTATAARQRTTPTPPATTKTSTTTSRQTSSARNRTGTAPLDPSPSRIRRQMGSRRKRAGTLTLTLSFKPDTELDA